MVIMTVRLSLILLLLTEFGKSQLFPSPTAIPTAVPGHNFFPDATETVVPDGWNVPVFARYGPSSVIQNTMHRLEIRLMQPFVISLEFIDIYGNIVSDENLSANVTVLSLGGVLTNNEMAYTGGEVVFSEIKYTHHPFFALPRPGRPKTDPFGDGNDHVWDELTFIISMPGNRLNGMTLSNRAIYVYPIIAAYITFSPTRPPAWPTQVRSDSNVVSVLPKYGVQVELRQSTGDIQTGIQGILITAEVVDVRNNSKTNNVWVKPIKSQFINHNIGIAKFFLELQHTLPIGHVVSVRLKFSSNDTFNEENRYPPIYSPGIDIFHSPGKEQKLMSLTPHSREVYTADDMSFYFNDTLPVLQIELLNSDGSRNTSLKNIFVSMFTSPTNLQFHPRDYVLTRLFVDGVASFDEMRIVSHTESVYFRFQIVPTEAGQIAALDQSLETSEFKVIAVEKYSIELIRGDWPSEGVIPGYPIPPLTIQILRSDGIVGRESMEVVTVSSDTGLINSDCRVQITDSNGAATFKDITYAVPPTPSPNATRENLNSPLLPTPTLTFETELFRGRIAMLSVSVPYGNPVSSPRDALIRGNCTVGVNYQMWIDPSAKGPQIIGQVQQQNCTSSTGTCLQTELVPYSETESLKPVITRVSQILQRTVTLNNSKYITIAELPEVDMRYLININDTGWVRMWLWCENNDRPICLMYPLLIGDQPNSKGSEFPFDIPLTLSVEDEPVTGTVIVDETQDPEIKTLIADPFTLRLTDTRKRHWHESELFEWVCRSRFNEKVSSFLPIASATEEERFKWFLNEAGRCAFNDSDYEIHAVILRQQESDFVFGERSVLSDGVAKFNKFQATDQRGWFNIEFQLVSYSWAITTPFMIQNSTSNWEPLPAVGQGPSPDDFIMPWDAVQSSFFIVDNYTSAPANVTSFLGGNIEGHVAVHSNVWMLTVLKIFLSVLMVFSVVFLDPCLTAAVPEIAALATTVIHTDIPSEMLFVKNDMLGIALRWILFFGHDSDTKFNSYPTAVVPLCVVIIILFLLHIVLSFASIRFFKWYCATSGCSGHTPSETAGCERFSYPTSMRLASPLLRVVDTFCLKVIVILTIPAVYPAFYFSWKYNADGQILEGLILTTTITAATLIVITGGAIYCLMVTKPDLLGIPPPRKLDASMCGHNLIKGYGWKYRWLFAVKVVKIAAFASLCSGQNHNPISGLGLVTGIVIIDFIIQVVVLGPFSSRSQNFFAAARSGFDIVTVAGLLLESPSSTSNNLVKAGAILSLFTTMFHGLSYLFISFRKTETKEEDIDAYQCRESEAGESSSCSVSVVFDGSPNHLRSSS